MNPIGIIIFLGFMALIVWSIIKLFKESKFSIYETKYFQKKFERDLMDKIRWIAIESHMGSIGSHSTYKEVREKELYKYIENEQNKIEVEQDFCIDFSNENEKDFVCKILDTHKQLVIESFFRNSLKKDKVFYRLDFLEYYMFRLCMFLDVENDGYKFDKLDNIELCKFLNRDGNYTTYELTEKGFVFIKLLYITTLFCVNNENLKTLFNNPKRTSSHLKEILESKKITYWSYRP